MSQQANANTQRSGMSNYFTGQTVNMTNDSQSASGLLREPSPFKLNSYYTINAHQDYVRAMTFAETCGRLFSISDDGTFMVNDISQ